MAQDPSTVAQTKVCKERKTKPALNEKTVKKKKKKKQPKKPTKKTRGQQERKYSLRLTHHLASPKENQQGQTLIAGYGS